MNNNIQLKIFFFFFLIFLLIFISAKCYPFLPKNNLNKNISLLFFSLIITLSLFLIFHYGKIGCEYKDKFTFSVTPAKLCSGGPYMYSSNPKRQEMCSKISPEELCQYNCPNGFVGRPVRWKRTPMSDDNWENKMCCHENTYQLQTL